VTINRQVGGLPGAHANALDNSKPSTILTTEPHRPCPDWCHLQTAPDEETVWDRGPPGGVARRGVTPPGGVDRVIRYNQFRSGADHADADPAWEAPRDRRLSVQAALACMAATCWRASNSRLRQRAERRRPDSS